jgi:transposase
MVARHALTDAQWDRVKGFLPPHGPKADNRLFVDAILWVARTGAAWRDLPERFGNWNSVWRRFARWAEAGVWERLLAAVRDPDLEVLILDSTVIRAHPAAAGAEKKSTGPAARRSRPSAGAGAGSGPRSTPPSTGPATRSKSG